MKNENEKRIEFILLKMKLITMQEFEAAAEVLREDPLKKIEDILLERGSITEFDLVRALGVKYDVPLVNLVTQKIPPKILRYVPITTAKKNDVIPVHITETALYLATSNPIDYLLFEKISQSCGKQVLPLLATKADIKAAIEQNYIQQDVNNIMSEIHREYADENDSNDVDPDVVNLSSIESNPIVRAVNIILQQAKRKNASDVHIEPLKNEVRVRIRVDGMLIETMRFDVKAFPTLVSRIKVIGNLDISEKRLPQDGRITVVIDDEPINMRLSTLPTIYGEKVVIRLLGSAVKGTVQTLEELGIEDYNMEKLLRAMKSPSGIILFTGPTGSGKTTTVYGCLNHLNSSDVNIITIEDPVEKTLEGLNQVQVNVRAGLTFAAGLRSVLRQDPDIVMVGEMRDAETTEIAARAAITGHLVVSTIHTNSASSTFMRIMDMGVEPYMVSSSIACVVAQRLIRKICKYCSEEYEPTEEELQLWDGEDLPEKFYKGRGCGMCYNTGYSGRVAVHEIIVVDGTIKQLILDKSDTSVFDDYLATIGYRNLSYNGQLLVREGVTSIQELYKLKYDVE